MNLIEIFKAGKRKDANGVEVNITTADLQQAVESYNVEYHEAPAVIGHPKHNHPAYAWVKRLQLDGDTLKAEFDQIDPEFAEMVETGRFKKVSASFYLANSPNNPKQGSLYLRHVGFLGAMPPAVKGLRNPEFAEGEEGVVDFSDWAESTLWRRLRDWFIGKYGQEEADKALPDYLVGSVQEDAIRNSLQPQKTESPIFNEPAQPEGDPEMSAEEKAELERLKAENQQLKEAQAKAEAEKTAAEAEKVQAELEATKAENVAFCEKLIADGKLAPVAKETALALLNGAAAINAGQTVDFNESENLLTLTKAFMGKQPKVVEFTEIATKEKAVDQTIDEVSYAEGTDPTSIEADQKIRAYAKEKGVSYTEAFNAIYK